MGSLPARGPRWAHQGLTRTTSDRTLRPPIGCTRCALSGLGVALQQLAGVDDAPGLNVELPTPTVSAEPHLHAQVRLGIGQHAAQGGARDGQAPALEHLQQLGRAHTAMASQVGQARQQGAQIEATVRAAVGAAADADHGRLRIRRRKASSTSSALDCPSSSARSSTQPRTSGGSRTHVKD